MVFELLRDVTSTSLPAIEDRPDLVTSAGPCGLQFYRCPQ